MFVVLGVWDLKGKYSAGKKFQIPVFRSDEN